MLSAFPAAFPGDSLFGNPFLPFGTGSLTFENYERDLPFHSQNVDENRVALPTQPCPEPLSSGSDITNPIPAPGSCESFQAERFQTSNPGPNRRNSKKLVNPGSPVGPTVVDEKRRRRMISNRDSARRSRLRKQKHVENLRNQVNRHKVVKRQLMNRLRLVVHQSQIFCAENECLRSEAAVLRRRLWDVRQLLLLNSQCINNSGLYTFHSLIT